MAVTDWEFRIIRDPIHGYIGITKKERCVLQTRAVQRLRRIKQLAHTHLVYPGATHSRSEHSLGTLHVADCICQRLGVSVRQRRIVRLAALLHDIGHGPFSHVSESVLARRARATGLDQRRPIHERITHDLVMNDRALSRTLGSDREAVAALLTGDEATAECGIISGPLDADRLDYLRRDSLHIGVAYGIFDVERILHMVKRIEERAEERSYLGVTYKAQDALEGYRIAIYSMYAQVYQHEARLAADAMLVRAIEMAIEEGVLDVTGWTYREADDGFLAAHQELDDSRLTLRILERSEGPARELVEALEDRDLFGAALIVDLKRGQDALKRNRLSRLAQDSEALKASEHAIADRGEVPNYAVVAYPDIVTSKLYAEPGKIEGPGPDEILVETREGHVEELSRLSPFQAEHFARMRLIVFCRKADRSRVEPAAREWLDQV